MRTLLPTALVALSATAGVHAVLVEHWWNISYATANPDGLQERRVIGVNGTWPPPPIEVNANDTLRVHAYNGLGNTGTGLHAHGNYFNGSSYFDGASGITQCPIPPGETFTYDIPTNLQHGTYWIHGHFQGQYVDGLRAPVVIHPAQEPHHYDEEYTVVLGDWYHDDHKPLAEWFMSWKNPTGAEPVPKSALVYVMQNGTYAGGTSGVSSGSVVGNNATLAFEPGNIYRLRLINTSALAMFWVWLDGHDMKVIEADGQDVEAYPIDVVPLSVAQRYSVLVTARNDTSSNFVLHANMNPDIFDTVPDDLQLNVSATIQYDASAPRVEGTTKDSISDLDDTKLVPIGEEGLTPADVSYNFHTFFDTFSDNTNRASFNNITFSFPKVPAIFTQQSMGNDSLNPRVYGAMTHAVVLKHLDNVEFTVFNWDAGFHPFHLHGHKFQIVQKVYDVDSTDVALNPPLDETQANPMRRDTVMVPPQGFVRMRFRADNPGTWIMHCHIDWHLTSGLAMTFIEAPEVSQERLQLPHFMYDQCEAQGIPTTGNVVGKMSTIDFAGEPYGPWPQIMGWTPKAKGAFAGCIIAALIGIGTVVWYALGGLDDAEVEEETRRRIAEKAARKGAIKGLVGKLKGGQ